MELKQFCKYPNSESFKYISKNTQNLMLKISKFCIEKRRGNMVLAQKILNYNHIENLSDIGKRGLKALLLSVKHTEDLTYGLLFRNIYTNIADAYPVLSVWVDGKIYLRIWYEADMNLTDAYFIQETDTGNIVVMYIDKLLPYLIHLIGKNDITIDSIDIEMEPNDGVEFYNKNTGITWKDRMCQTCISFIEKMGIEYKTNSVPKGLGKLKNIYRAEQYLNYPYTALKGLE